MSSPHSYTEEQLALIRRYYNSGEMSHKKLAATIGTTGSALKWKAGCLGLTRSNVQHSFRRFTPAEDEILMEMAGQYNISSIAVKVKHTPQAVQDRLRYLRISYNTTNRDGWYTLSDAAQIFGMSTQTVRKLIDSGEIKARTFYNDKPKTMYGEVWQISKESLRAYVRKHPHQLNGRKVDMINLVEILVGVTI